MNNEPWAILIEAYLQRNHSNEDRAYFDGAMEMYCMMTGNTWKTALNQLADANRHDNG